MISREAQRDLARQVMRDARRARQRVVRSWKRKRGLGDTPTTAAAIVVPFVLFGGLTLLLTPKAGARRDDYDY